MSKPLDDAAIARAMREAARIAASGTPEQRAGMFRPAPARALAAKAATRSLLPLLEKVAGEA